MYAFNTQNGNFIRKTTLEYSPYGPEIADIEISTICDCGFVGGYNSNTTTGKNMTLETFKQVFANLPSSVCQIAFGIGNVSANPELFDILRYTREHGVIPNITISGNDSICGDDIRALASLCGGISVSCYDVGRCFNTIRRLQSAGAQQVNIHQILHAESIPKIITLIDGLHENVVTDLHALILLWYKPCGRNAGVFKSPSKTDLKRVVDDATEKGVTLGFDSCSAPNITDLYPPKFADCIEACESTLFSIYVNVDGRVFPCSFSERGDGIDVTKPVDFVKDVWFADSTVAFREKLLAGCRKCPVYNLEVSE